ncbi:hypothetical protein LP416_11520 [Polaromonas sp. P2-4]|nr:hypothetical protein LP416_11520 [Polaromonas sp. P2-4]
MCLIACNTTLDIARDATQGKPCPRFTYNMLDLALFHLDLSTPPVVSAA